MFGLSYFFGKKKKEDSRSEAKKRLQLMIAYDRGGGEQGVDFLDDMRIDLLGVIRKYMPVDDKDIDIQMEKEGSRTVLGISISTSLNKNDKNEKDEKDAFDLSEDRVFEEVVIKSGSVDPEEEVENKEAPLQNKHRAKAKPIRRARAKQTSKAWASS